MKRYIKYSFVFIIIIMLAFFYTYKLFNTNKDLKELININSLSDDYMITYFNDVDSINNDNTIIVISRNEIKNTYGASKIISAPNNQYYLLYDSSDAKEEALKEFKNDKTIISVQENNTFALDEISNNSWGITIMGLDTAIDIANSLDLPEVVVAILDSGVNCSLANSTYNGKIKETYSVISSNDEEMTDENGHGTYVFGILAEGTPDNVKIIPIKVTDGNELNTIELVTAINYINYYHKADVINLSLGTYDYDEALDQAIEAAKDNNIITVTSAGNDNTSNKHYPSALDNTISISSVNSSLEKSDFSNYGSTISFVAPGTNVKSFDSYQNGTSFATPYASSAVAILKSYNKNLTLNDVMKLLKQYAKDIGDPGWDQDFGYGLISFEDAVFCTDGIDCDEYNVFKNNIKEITVDIMNVEDVSHKGTINIISYSATDYDGNDNELSNCQTCSATRGDLETNNSECNCDIKSDFDVLNLVIILSIALSFLMLFNIWYFFISKPNKKIEE